MDLRVFEPYRLLTSEPEEPVPVPGPEGFKARNVSRSDLGRTAFAHEVAERTGASLDEALVNRLRYVDGTPRGSTRWIDTGWALVLIESFDR